MQLEQQLIIVIFFIAKETGSRHLKYQYREPYSRLIYTIDEWHHFEKGEEYHHNVYKDIREIRTPKVKGKEQRRFALNRPHC